MAYIWLHARRYKMKRDSSHPQAALSSRKSFRDAKNAQGWKGQQKSACCVRSR